MGDNKLNVNQKMVKDILESKIDYLENYEIAAIKTGLMRDLVIMAKQSYQNRNEIAKYKRAFHKLSIEYDNSLFGEYFNPEESRKTARLIRNLIPKFKKKYRKAS